MTTIDCEQGTEEWLKARIGKVTASEADALLTPEFKPRTGEGVHTYLCEKLAEEILGQPKPQFSGFASDQGSILEDEARPWFELEYDCDVKEVGFIVGADGRCGCSPDGLIGDDGGVEIKCPQPTNHVRYLLAGTVPKEYIVQVHFSLYVTGREWWKFVSYNRGFKPLVVDVQRDDKICATIQETLAAFYQRYDEAMAKLEEGK